MEYKINGIYKSFSQQDTRHLSWTLELGCHVIIKYHKYEIAIFINSYMLYVYIMYDNMIKVSRYIECKKKTKKNEIITVSWGLQCSDYLGTSAVLVHHLEDLGSSQEDNQLHQCDAHCDPLLPDHVWSSLYQVSL